MEKKNIFKTEPGKIFFFLKLNLKKNNIFKTEPGKKIIFSKLNLEKKKDIFKTGPEKKLYFFIKVFTTSKNFCNIDEYKYEPRITVNWLELS